MKTVIIYDSYFGNTEKIANEIGKTISNSHEVEIHKVSNISYSVLDGADLLIIGSPTRAFNPTKPISSFIKGIPSNKLQGIKATVFDTRMDVNIVKSKVLNFFVKLFGYAAETMEKTLKNKGVQITAKSEWFYVLESEGPLKDGELEKASEWGKSIINSL